VTKKIYEQLSFCKETATAAWVSFGQNITKTIFCGHYRSTFNHCDVIGLQTYRIRWNKAK